LASGCASTNNRPTGQAYLLYQAISAPYENPGIDKGDGTHSLDLANALAEYGAARGGPGNDRDNELKVQNQSTDPMP